MKYKEQLKKLINNDSRLLSIILWIYNHMPFNNSFRMHNNSLKIENAYLKKVKISVHGKNNAIYIHNGCRLSHCKILIFGDNNIINLSEFVFADNAEFYIEDNNNRIICNKHTTFAGKIHLACTEGKEILIGENCLFSSDIVLRTGDSHSIIDSAGERLNQAKSIKIGNHVWIGYRALINKGVIIPDNCVVGTGSVLTRQFHNTGSCIAGNPAKAIKENISWLVERI